MSGVTASGVAVRPLAVREMAVSDRPVQRVMTCGPSALSVPELLAAIIGGSSANETALALYQRVGTSAAALLRASPLALQSVPGMGEASAARLAAALELVKQARGEGESATPLRNPSDVWTFMRWTEDLSQEE